MAIIPFNESKLVLSSLNGTNTYALGSGHYTTVSAVAVHIVKTGTISASIAITGRSSVPKATDDLVPYVAILYRKIFLNGAIGDGSLVSTAITDTSLIIIPTDGISPTLDFTYTSGSGTLTAYITPLSGTAGI